MRLKYQSYKINADFSRKNFEDKIDTIIETLTNNIASIIQKAVNHCLEDFRNTMKNNPQEVYKILQTHQKDARLAYILHEEKNAELKKDFEAYQKMSANLSYEQFLRCFAKGGKNFPINLPDGTAANFRLFHKKHLISGSYGRLDEVEYTTPTSSQLEKALLKSSHGHLPETSPYLNLETEMAARINEIIDKRKDHPGSRHILKPLGWENDILLLPRVSPGNNTYWTFADMINGGVTFDSQFLANLADIAQAYDLLTQEGIIPIDGKTNNMAWGEEGGVLIDLGGLIDKYEYQEAKYEHDKKQISCYSKKTGQWQDYYLLCHLANPAVVALEVGGGSPNDLSAKYSLGLSLGEFLKKRGYINDSELFNEPSNPESISNILSAPIPDLIVHRARVLPEIQRVYGLFLRLISSRKHLHGSLPNGNNNPDYISLPEAAKSLYQLSSDFKNLAEAEISWDNQP